MQRAKPVQKIDDSNVIAVISNKKSLAPNRAKKLLSTSPNRARNQVQRNNIAVGDTQLNSAYSNRQAGTAKITPQIYTDSAFVF
ncbi:hypothetical protein ACKLNO_09455 [Neisseriaceae bacterium B1]